METRRAGKEAMRQTRRANLSTTITSNNKGKQSPSGTLHKIKRLKTSKITDNSKVSSKESIGPDDDWAGKRKSLPAVSMDTKSQGTKPVDSMSKSPGIRTRLSTGSIHMNGTTTISTAKERAEQEHIMKQIEKDVTRPPVSLLKKRNSSSGSGESMDHPPPKKRKIGRNDGSGEDNRNDYYCWLCHKEGTVVCCELCPRVYHTKCLELAGELPHDWVCPECEKIMRAECTDTRSRAMEMLTIDQLCTLLMYALERMQHAGSEPFQAPVDVSLVPIYSDYIFNAMDLETLEKNIKKRMYGSTESFMSDTKWILHNCIIFNGAHNKLTASSKMIVKICKHEMNEIELCPDCYLNSCIRRNDEWFSELCRTPHTLVWAKLKGYPFWPAKALREEDGQVDVRFFGAHDRSWVPVSQCFLLSKNIPTSLQKGKKNAGLDGAIDELNKHVIKLREKFGHFEYAPFRTPYDKTDSYKPVNIKTPGKVTSPSKSHGPVMLPYKNHSSLHKRVKLSCKTAAAVRSKYNAIVNVKKVDTAVARSSGPLLSSQSGKAVESSDSVTDIIDEKVNTVKTDTDVTEDGPSDIKMSSVTLVSSNVKKSFVSMGIVEKLEQKIQKMNEKETDESGDICDIKTSDTCPALINETKEIEESFHEEESSKSSVSNTECNMKENHELDTETSDLKNNTDEEVASPVSIGTSNETSNSDEEVASPVSMGTSNETSNTDEEVSSPASKGTINEKPYSGQGVIDMDQTVSKLSQRISEIHKTTSEVNQSVSCDILSEGSQIVQNDDNKKPKLLSNLTTDNMCISEGEIVKNIIQNDDEKKGSLNDIKETPNDMAKIPDNKMEAPKPNKESKIEKLKSVAEEVSRNFESDLCNKKFNSCTFQNVTGPTSTPTENTDKAENKMLIDNNSKCAEDNQKTKDKDVEDCTTIDADNEFHVNKESKDIDAHEDMIVEKECLEETSKLEPDKTSDDVKNRNPESNKPIDDAKRNKQANDRHDDIYVLNEKSRFHIKVIDSEQRNEADSKTAKYSSLSDHAMDVGKDDNCADKCESQTLQDNLLKGNIMDMSELRTVKDNSEEGHIHDMSESQIVKDNSLKGHIHDMSESQTVKENSLKSHIMDMSEAQTVKVSSVKGHINNISEAQTVEGQTAEVGHSGEDSDVDRLVIDLDTDKDSPNKYSVKGGKVNNGASFTHGTSPLTKPAIVSHKQDVLKMSSNQNEHSSYDKNKKNASSISRKKENVSTMKTPQIKDTGKSNQRLDERENVINKDDQQTKKIVIEVPSSVQVIDRVHDQRPKLQQSTTSSSSYVPEVNLPNIIDLDRLMVDSESLMVDSDMVAVNTGELQSQSKTPQEISDRFMKKILTSIQTNVDEMLEEFQQTRPVPRNDNKCEDTEVLKWNCKNEILELKHNFELTVSELKSSWCAQREQLMKSMTTKHQEEMERTLSEAKKKQWCANCEKEAIFYCCWNTSYCNYPCQQAHWPMHALTCMQTNKQNTSESKDEDDSTDGSVKKSSPSDTAIGTSGKQTMNQQVTISSNSITSASFRHLPAPIVSAIRREEEKRGEARGHVNQKFIPAPVMQNIHPMRMATNSSNMMNQVAGSVFLNQGMPAVPLTQQALTNNMILQQPILQQTMFPVQRQQQPFSNTILFPQVNTSQPRLLGYNTRHPF